MSKTGISDPVGAKAHLAAALPYIEAELGKLQAQTIARASQLYMDDKLSEATAKSLWIELFVIMGLGRRLSTGVKLDAMKAAELLNQKAT